MNLQNKKAHDQHRNANYYRTCMEKRKRKRKVMIIVIGITSISSFDLPTSSYILNLNPPLVMLN